MSEMPDPVSLSARASVSSVLRRRVTALTVFVAGAAAGVLGLQALGAAPAPPGDAPVVSASLSTVSTVSSLAAGPRKDEPGTTFRIASLNVLGHGHTAPGGNRKGWRQGPERMRMQLDVLLAEKVDVIGFQELQKPQYDVFRAATAGQFATWPGNIGGRSFLRNSIAWRTATWTLVDTSWIKVPYFKGDMLRMPVVLLQHNVTGQQAYFMNFQNPANARGNADRWRAQGRSMQMDLVNRLRVTSGLPVFWTGDFNDREKAFCDITRNSDLVSASGGTNAGGRCLPTKPMAVDWIFGSSETAWSDYSLDARYKIRKSTDHPLVLATATVPPGLVPVCTPVPEPPVDS
ncbi:hypothetical protein GCM10023340_27240 [Nocardioides marinquilinus]|uniref:Endonuclease/exonuclease/phosphatase domain-containing protein n=1 Tax=Nocardioides marinquilinus TaxID=1210400 RepID=A0ABP9PV43_9ACTN